MGAIHQQLMSYGSAGGGGGPTDPLFAFVQLLVHFDGTNGSTTYVDNSSRGGGFTNGGAALTTTSPMFGTACLDVAATYMIANDAVALGAGTGDFCFEIAFKTAAPTQVKNLFEASGFLIYTLSSQFHLYSGGTDRVVGGTVLTSTWQELCVDRFSGTTGLYVQGTRVGTWVDATNYSHEAVTVGGANGGSVPCTGQFDECRFTVGSSRRSGASSYTVEAAAFPDS